VTGDRSERRHAELARLRRQRLLTTAVALGVLAVGATAIVLVAGRGGGSPGRRAAPRPPADIRYGGSKLPPRPVRRPGGLPSAGEQRRAVARLVKLGLPLLCAGHRGRYIALTFDDGPGPYTELAMRILRKRHLRATFFLVGKEVVLDPSLPAREAALGAVGDHTWTHPYLPGLSDAAILDQIRSARAVVRRTSKAPVLLFRPPYGGHDARVDRIINSLGLLQVLWSVDSGDSTGSDVEGVYRNVLAGLKPGAIILMHENRATTIKSLIRYVLPAIRRRGFKPVSVPELLALDPPSLDQVRHRRC
jgi:peptidoglycan/xylan/chitin deacetylase (PgdA/CDA1 family)